MTTEAMETSAAPAEGEVLPEETQTAAQEAESAPAEQEESADDQAAESKRHKGGFQKRIDELTRRVAEERREKERLLSLVESTVQKPKATQEAQAQSAEPRREDFEDYEAYLEARAEFRAVKALETRLAAVEKQRSEESAQAQRQRVAQEFAAKINDARTKYADFDEVTSADVPVTSIMSQTIMESEKGPELVYYLGKNSAEAARIAALSPTAQARELGKIEERLSLKPVKASNFPEPIKPVGARSTGGDPLSDKLPMDQWAKNFEKAFYGKRA